MEASSLKSTLEGLQEKLLASMVRVSCPLGMHFLTRPFSQGADAAAAEGARIVAEAAAEARDAEATATLGIPGPKARNKRAFEVRPFVSLAFPACLTLL